MYATKGEKNISWLKLLVLPILLVIVLFFSGCATTEKVSYMGVEDVLTYTCTYDSASNRTRISWESYIDNTSIYSIKGYSVEFDIYKDSTLVYEAKKTSYDEFVKHNTTKDINNYFYVDGEVDTIEWVAWNAHYCNLWDSYKVWWISAIVIVAVAITVLLLLIFVADVDAEDLVNALWVIVPLLSVFIAFSGVLGLNWVILLIVIGGCVICGAVAGIVCAFL